MNGVSSSSSSSFQCVDSAVQAAGANAACAGAAAAAVATGPSIAGPIFFGTVAAVTCFVGCWNTAKAVDHCSSNESSGGMSPAQGRDTVEDYRNSPADALWRSQVEIEPLDRDEGFIYDDSSY